MCQNGSECVEGVCECLPGYFGEDCEYYDPCSVIICENGGTCDDWDGECHCLEGYEGTNCELEEREKFVGSYLGYGYRDCWPPFSDGAESGVPFSIEPHATDITKVWVHFDGQVFVAEIEGAELFMYNQAGTANYNYSGIANTYDDSLYISIHKYYFDYDCNFQLKAAYQ